MSINFIAVLTLIFGSSVAWSSEQPKWVNNPKLACPPQSLCAVGEAAGRLQAKAQARAEIAKVFQSQIKSKFSEEIMANEKLTEQSMSSTNVELSEVTLEGIQIKELYEDKLGFYALAVLNKAKLANRYGTRLAEMNNEMKALWESGTVGDLMKIGPLLGRHSLYAERVSFLTGKRSSLPFDYQAYLKRKKDLFKNVVILIGDDLKMPEELREMIANEFSLLGLRLKTNRDSANEVTHRLKGELKVKKAYLNVEGFERYSYNLTLKAINRQNVETGLLQFATMNTGRNREQSLEKALIAISVYLNKNINQLNIE